MSANEEAFAPIRSFLEGETLNHFISEHHQPLGVLRKGSSTIADAMKLLSDQQILSAPVLDEEGEYLGAVSVPDILRGLVRNLEANLGEGYLDNLAEVSAEELNTIGAFYASKSAATVLHEADLWMKGDASTTLMAVLREGFQIEQTRVHHRIYVCDPSKATHRVASMGLGEGPAPTVINIAQGSEKEGASAWVPTDVVTQLDLVNLLVEKGLASVSATVDELGLARTVVSTVSTDTPALLAFHHMAMDHKSAVGILDAQGMLVGSISVADLRDMPTDSFGLLLKPISELLTTVFKSARLDKIAKDASFEALLQQMTSQRLHRVYVPDSEGGVRSIITLTDVLRVVSGCSIPKARRSLDIQRSFEEKRRAESLAAELAAYRANGGEDSEEDDEDDDEEEEAEADAKV